MKKFLIITAIILLIAALVWWFKFRYAVCLEAVDFLKNEIKFSVNGKMQTAILKEGETMMLNGFRIKPTFTGGKLQKVELLDSKGKTVDSMVRA